MGSGRWPPELSWHCLPFRDVPEEAQQRLRPHPGTVGPVLRWGGGSVTAPHSVCRHHPDPLQGDDEDFSVLPTQSPSQVQRNLESRSQEEIDRKVGGGGDWGARGKRVWGGEEPGGGADGGGVWGEREEGSGGGRGCAPFL